jgi:hypothetical protein
MCWWEHDNILIAMCMLPKNNCPGADIMHFYG